VKLSISSFVYLNYPLDETIRRVAAAGYDGIDIWGGRPHAYRRDLSAEASASLRRLLDEQGLAVASFIPAQFRYPTSLCSPIDIIRSDSIDYICDSIATAAGLGAPVVSVCPGHSLFGQTQDDAWSRLADSLRKIASRAGDYGIRIALEPADRYETDLVHTTAGALRLLGEVGRSEVGVVLDNGHCEVVGERADEAVANLGDKLYHVHLDDNDGRRDQHLIPGEGSCDIPSFMRALKRIDYSGYVTAELSFDYTLDPDEASRLTLERMRGYAAASQATMRPAEAQ
jgi:fructoselysine 3-epimerase